MRSVRLYLPALLALLVPLVFLFWLGSRELSRLDRRADSLLRNEAYVFLQAADRRISKILTEKASRRLEEFVDLDNRSLVEAARELSVDAWALDLFLLDGNGGLVYPRLPWSPQPSVPLRTLPRTGDAKADRMILLAALLESVGDLDGARQQLEELLGYSEQQRGLATLKMRCLFDLACLQARAGQTMQAQVNYLKAGGIAGDIVERVEANRGSSAAGGPTAGGPPPDSAAAEDAAAILLLHEVGRAQISNQPVALLEILRDISTGIHDSCDEGFLDAVFDRVVAAIPSGGLEYAIAGAREDNEVRKAGRRFGRVYEQLAADPVRKLLNQVPKGKSGPFFHVLTTSQGSSSQGSSILAIRRADMAEQLQYEAAWVGVRLDFAALLNEEVMAAINSDEGGFFSLAILDPDGTPILPAHPQSAVDFPVPLAPVESLAGLRLQAIPVRNPGADVRAAEANRLYLVLALIVVAAGGAIFLMRSVSRASELARLKVQLVSRVSHELKTPLAVIKMYGDTLALGRVKDKAQAVRFAGIVSREADRLSGMIEQILDFSRKEAGTLTYASKPTNLSSLILNLVEEYRPHVESRGARLETQLKGGLQVVVDPQAMTNAFLNLVENAVKYTPESTRDRTVEVSLSQNDGTAVLDVSDHGIGIPEREQADVFSPFYRATTAGEVHGAGLGLNLVRHFANSHGGTIEALARPDGGTIMRMTLPLAPAPQDPEHIPVEPLPSEEILADD